ncbi:MAG: hypothetical protein A2937_02425 [Candidatus Yonathbacteria bacterium RIFCSPLOWO2_01_FULL_47_33b]|uniref:Uncharacterized protein n=1 Tax=Candidatus Yonathbacteria bacterium RIFCSPLOWO2_01_FULL_47_33b TaxID=1802727 RepID=A0A1G2SG97_9BACT|nr:MAG: hypothetical protein A2937_02425 [Candidatus Yonathbacteria bacterium RIFCSPLOWO2_01_FULL_47_33b]
MKKILDNRGFTEIFFIVIVGVIAMAYFNIDLRAIFSDPLMQKIFGIIKGAWFNYLLPLGGYLKVSILGLFN